jgi:hypothetical protein
VVLAALAQVFDGYNAEEKAAQLKKVRFLVLVVGPFAHSEPKTNK